MEESAGHRTSPALPSSRFWHVIEHGRGSGHGESFYCETPSRRRTQSFTNALLHGGRCYNDDKREGTAHGSPIFYCGGPWATERIGLCHMSTVSMHVEGRISGRTSC